MNHIKIPENFVAIRFLIKGIHYDLIVPSSMQHKFTNVLGGEVLSTFRYDLSRISDIKCFGVKELFEDEQFSKQFKNIQKLISQENLSGQDVIKEIIKDLGTKVPHLHYHEYSDRNSLNLGPAPLIQNYKKYIKKPDLKSKSKDIQKRRNKNKVAKKSRRAQRKK